MVEVSKVGWLKRLQPNRIIYFYTRRKANKFFWLNVILTRRGECYSMLLRVILHMFLEGTINLR